MTATMVIGVGFVLIGAMMALGSWLPTKIPVTRRTWLASRQPFRIWEDSARFGRVYEARLKRRRLYRWSMSVIGLVWAAVGVAMFMHR